MADAPDDLAGRLDRIETLLRRRLGSAPPVTAGPEVRSARSIVSRIDDVWVAVTEGNERVVAAIAGAGGAPAEAGMGEAVREPGGLARIEEALPDPARAGTGADDTIHPRLDRIEGALAELARAGTGAGADDATIHLRLNRIEEALAGVAGRLAEPAPESGVATAAAVERLDAEVRRLGRSVEALAEAVGASAARSGDGTLTDRIGRLRDQFRRP